MAAMTIEKVTLHLMRQHAEAVRDEFFPYIEMLCTTWIRDTEFDEKGKENLNEIAGLMLHEEIKTIFIDKLNTTQKKYIIDLKQSQAVILYKHLQCLPINAKFNWLNDLKDSILNEIEKQLWEVG